MRILMFMILGLGLTNCASQTTSNKAKDFSGVFQCPGYSEGPIRWAPFTQVVNHKKKDGFDIITHEALSVDSVRLSPSTEEVYKADNKWRPTQVRIGSRTMEVRFRVRMVQETHLEWEADVPAYRDSRGNRRSKSFHTGAWWIDSQSGDKFYRASFANGKVFRCRRLHTNFATFESSIPW